MIGLTEIIILALIIVFALLWWLWPKDDRPDLTVPPQDLLPRQNIFGDQRQMTGENIPAAEHDLLSGVGCHNMIEQPDTDPLMQQAYAAVCRGHKIEAIKLVRQAKNIRLAEAKAFVENMERRNP